jgi:hypothetical protein
MRDMKERCSKISLLLPIAIVVLIAGCIGPGPSGGGGGPGIVIERFEPSLTNIESDEEVELRLGVRNIGDYNEAPAVAELTVIDPTTWNLYGDIYRPLGTLLAPDPESGTAGGTKTAEWLLRAPRLSRGQTMTYYPAARVYYYYETKAIKPIWFVTSDELKTLIDTGQPLSTEPTTVTSGPLSVQILAGEYVKTPDWRDTKFQIQIKIDNVGGGHVFPSTYPVAVDVKWPDGVTPVGDCPREFDFGGVIYENLPPGLIPPAGRYVKLWKDKSLDISCEFVIINPPTNKALRNFEVKLGYIYYVEQGTQITVKGVEEFI